MNSFLTKAQLYARMDALRRERLGLSAHAAPGDLSALCREDCSLTVEHVPFCSRGLRGMAVLSSRPGETDIILLNSSLGEIEHTFYLAHELVHLCLHRAFGGLSFQCYDTPLPQQDACLEWQANEGAAELLLPYRALLPAIGSRRELLTSAGGIAALKRALAQEFRVSPSVLFYRLESLKYEVLQYLSGAPLEEITLVSATGQQQSGITAASLNDLEQRFRRRQPGGARPGGRNTAARPAQGRRLGSPAPHLPPFLPPRPGYTPGFARALESWLSPD